MIDAECKCAYHPPKKVLYQPRQCSLNSSRCAADREKINECALCLGHTNLLHRRRHGRQARLIDALLSGSLAVVGDSMSRQSYVTLLQRLRGDDEPVVDFNVHSGVTYKLFVATLPTGSASYARVADGLALPHMPLDWLAKNVSDEAADAASASPGKSKKKKSAQRSEFDWAAERAIAERREAAAAAAATALSADAIALDAAPLLRSASVGFYWAPCSYMMRDAAKELHGEKACSTNSPQHCGGAGSYWRRVVYFAPAYWHLTGACGRKAMLNATVAGVMHVWNPLLQLSNSSVQYTVVTAPTENVPDRMASHLQALNRLLRKQFELGAFPPNWSLFDWAALMSEARLPTVVPMGDQKHSWHYACQFYRLSSWYTLSAHHNISLMTKVGSGECGEEANTLLWERILLPRRGRESV